MLMINEDSQSFFCIPNKYKNLASFEQTREAYEEELVLETMKPFTSCGHAFVCLDSIYSVDECLTRFKTKPTAYFTYIKQLCASFLSSVKNPLTVRDRNLSTFIKMDELQEQELEHIYKDTILVMNKVTEPSDIIWKNMRGVRGLFIGRRILLLFVSLLIIFFVSSPAVILAKFQQMDKSKFLEFDWVNQYPGGALIRQHLPPAVIIIINQILIYFIDVMSLAESHVTHSQYHKSIYIKSVIYLTLNMLVIPALCLGEGNQNKTVVSIWTLITTRQASITQWLSEFYLSNNGTFFVSLVIQQACSTSAYYVMNFPDLVNSYASPWLAHFQR